MISSVGNPTIRRVRRLRKRMWRERTSRVLVEGHRAVAAALDRVPVEMVLHTPNAARLRASVLDLAASAGARVHEVAPNVMAYLSSATTAPDVLAVAPMREARLLDLRASAVILSGVRDPATLGSIMASAAAAGMSGVAVCHGCADVFSAKVLRAAQGAHYRLTLVRDADLKETAERLRDDGARIVALAAEGPAPWEAGLAGPIALLVPGAGGLGNEEAVAEATVSVPAIAQAPSLSVRAGVVLYEWVRQGGAA